MTGTEIERKWLLKRLPDDRKALRSSSCYQIYVSKDPCIRITKRFASKPGLVKVTCGMTLKGVGDLSRRETNLEISNQQYLEIYRFIGGKVQPIEKVDYFYSLEGIIDPSKLADLDEQLRVSIVDQGTPNEFIYAEVEFLDEEDAMAFEFPFPECEAVDVTFDPNYKMVNYWYRTRT